MRSVDISVVVTNYNYGRYIRRCVRSLLNQDISRSAYEIVVVDDNSTDNSLEVLAPFVKSDEIKLIVNSSNLGIGGSSRVGVDHSRAKYFVRVDADDFVQPQFLYILSSVLKFRPDLVGVSCDYFLTDTDEQILSVGSFEDNNIACGLMLRTSYLESIGSYDPDKRVFEDRDLFNRLHMDRIYHLPVPLYNYVKHGQSVTDNHAEETGAHPVIALSRRKGPSKR